MGGRRRDEIPPVLAQRRFILGLAAEAHDRGPHPRAALEVGCQASNRPRRLSHGFAWGLITTR